MKKRSFAVVSMCLLRDSTPPSACDELLVKKGSDGSVIHVPVGVQAWSNKEKFVKEMAKRAEELWDLHQETIDDNEEVKKAREVVERHRKELN